MGWVGCSGVGGGDGCGGECKSGVHVVVSVKMVEYIAIDIES